LDRHGLCFLDSNVKFNRQSRFEDFYDKDDGDWGYFDANIDEDREQFIELQVKILLIATFFKILFQIFKNISKDPRNSR